MGSNHVVELPRFVWIMKIVQTVDTVLVLALSAYLIAAFTNAVPVAPGYSIWVVRQTSCLHLQSLVPRDC